MDRLKVAALLESGVLQAFAEGKTLQILLESGWEDVPPSVALSFDDYAEKYRVKPEPLHDWAVKSNYNCLSGCPNELTTHWYVVRGKTESWVNRTYPGYEIRQLVDIVDE